MMKKLLPTLLLGCLFVVSCEDPQVTERATLYKEIIAIHDEMMAQMTDIKKGKFELDDRIKNAVPEDSLRTFQYKAARKRFQLAEDAMTGWMNQFSEPAEEIPHEEAITYLKDQKTKVEKMQADMIKHMELGFKGMKE